MNIIIIELIIIIIIELTLIIIIELMINLMQSMGAEYRMAHIQNVKTDDPLVGKPGLRLKVIINDSDFQIHMLQVVV